MRAQVVFASLWVFAVLGPVVSGQYLCTYTANINITNADMKPAAFVVSSFDCCQLCSDTSGCVASIYSNYYCHLKSSLEPQMVSIGPTLITQVGPTPPPSKTPIPPPPPSPSTPAPTPSPPAPTPAPPAPPTPAPASSVTLVREVSCLYSAQCSRRSDYSCVTNVYPNDQCIRSTIRSCGSSHITVERYSGDSCAPPATSTKKEPLNECDATTDETYVGHYCDTWPAPAVNMTMERTVCPYGCNDGSECTQYKWMTGSCVSNPMSSLPGESLMVWCFPAYVVFTTYGGLSCTGQPAASIAEPIGPTCFLDNNQFHHLNICG